MGFFIRDLHRQIEQLHTEQFNKTERSIFTVYRGQGLSKADFVRFMNNRGGLLSFNNFLSTTINREISFAFAHSSTFDSNLVGILFQLKIDPSISSVPFANLMRVGYFQEEQEVLFSMHTVFRINEIRQIENNLWEISVSLTNDNDEQLKALTEHVRRNFSSGTGFQRLAAFMLEIGEYSKAINIYETLLRETRSNEDQQAISAIHNQLGAIYSLQGETDKAITHYYTSLEMKLTHLSPNDPSLSPVYSNIGGVLRNQNQLNAALEYMERALNTELQAPQSDPLKIASYHNNIGLVFTDMIKYDDALTHYEQALEIQQKYLPSVHPELATSYNNIGAIYNELQDYSKALSYYERSLDIMQRSLPPTHPDFVTLYNNLGAIHNELHDYNNALSYYEKSLDIIQRSLSPNHPSLSLVYHNLSLTFYRLHFYTTALTYGEKALEIFHRTLEPDHPQLIACQQSLDAIRAKL
ncbi:unnamed protein product [Rotaria sp. Silwood2]|nr:unnamed protein product [Rotaria sp. Silwood2]CAF4418765.1 unnamed protein product [Rotaria sp. Silwood2]